MNGTTAELAAHRLPRLLVLSLWMVAVGIVAGWLALAALHVGDDYRVFHTQGVWMATAEGARAGRLYPPIVDGEHYAGTRYMPVPILLNAAASALVGDPLVGGKLLAAALMATLLVLVAMALRRMSCPWPVAAALTAVVVATDAGLQAGTTIGGDVVAAMLQVGALTIALHGRATKTVAVAGVLAGLAAASKLTGVWGALAILTWLATERRWRTAALFAATCAATTALVLGVIDRLTGGGLSENLLAFSSAGVQGMASLLRAPNQLLFQLNGHATGAVVLVPLAVLGALISNWRRPSVIHLALGYALLMLVIVYTDVGTGFNQLLDIVVLNALAVGLLAGRAATSDGAEGRRIVLLAVTVSVLWAAGIDLVRTVGFDLRRAAATTATRQRTGRAAQTVAAMVQPGQAVLTEDPAIDVALGRRPLVMDPFMLVRLDRVHPERVDPLIASVAHRRFDLVVLVVPLDRPDLDFWWSDYSFGPRIARALRDSYRPDGTVGRYYLYRPVR